MVKIEEFKISYRPEDNVGVLHLALADHTGATITIDDPSWASFLFDMLTHEKEVFYDNEHKLITMGMEPPGEHSNP